MFVSLTAASKNWRCKRAFDRDDQIEVIVLTNRDPPTAMMVTGKLLKALFDDKACAGQSAQ